MKIFDEAARNGFVRVNFASGGRVPTVGLFGEDNVGSEFVIVGRF